MARSDSGGHKVRQAGKQAGEWADGWKVPSHTGKHHSDANHLPG